jgi:dihydropteroate synthase
MGILNVTPDSFSDGGLHFDPDAAVAAGLRMTAEGADLIDIGGESTRPGATPVSAAEELSRILPVVRALALAGVRISLDTQKAAVARLCLQEGAWMVNDVSALSDPEMATVCAEAKCQVCLMHMLGTPATMQSNPSYKDVVTDVLQFLLDRAREAVAHGIDQNSLWLDPGFGFGKTTQHNLDLLRNLGRLVDTPFPVIIGLSRKSFVGKVSGTNVPAERLEGTLALQTWAQIAGVNAIRAHDVLAARRAIDSVAAVIGPQ